MLSKVANHRKWQSDTAGFYRVQLYYGACFILTRPTDLIMWIRHLKKKIVEFFFSLTVNIRFAQVTNNYIAHNTSIMIPIYQYALRNKRID